MDFARSVRYLVEGGLRGEAARAPRLRSTAECGENGPSADVVQFLRKAARQCGFSNHGAAEHRGRLSGPKIIAKIFNQADSAGERGGHGAILTYPDLLSNAKE